MRTFCPEGHLSKLGKNKAAGKTVYTPTVLSEAIESGEILEGKAVMCDSEYNLIVDLGCMKGIIPKSEGALGADSGKIRDIALISRVGKAVQFKVTAVNVNDDGLLYAELSRKKAQEEYLDFIKEKGVGSIVNARVTHLESFGAFCDIGCGIIALLPIDSISVSRISHPADRLFNGEDIKVIIKAIDGLNRITLSLKELLGTWEENARLFKAGQTVSGIVRSVEEYGIFIELTPNLAGLAEIKKGVSVGQTASVYIKSIIPEKMKVKLIIIDSFFDDYAKELTYYYENDTIKKWQYSPDECERTIVSLF